jgi:hypothetical protein
MRPVRRGIAEGEAGLNVAETLDHPYTLCWTLWGLVNPYILRGELGRATGLIDPSLPICVRQ